MALKRPPNHRIDAPIIFVHDSDSAWDNERVVAEQKRLREAGLDPKMHPVARYQGGFTRYDLSADTVLFGASVTVADYLDDSKQPTKWTLRRLEVGQWYEIHPSWQRAHRNGEKPFAAFIRSAIVGVVKVENGPTLELANGRLTDNDLIRLHDLGQAIDVDVIYDLGQAVYQASMPLVEAERRPLG